MLRPFSPPHVCYFPLQEKLPERYMKMPKQ